MPRVRLSHSELMTAAFAGVMRHVAARKKKAKQAYGQSSVGWSEHIEGAAGEKAFAKALNRYWSNELAATPNKKPDVANYEVRTRTRHDYDLVVRENDDESLVALVTGSCGDYMVRGWIRAGDAKRPEWFTSHADRPPQYYVPQSALKPFPELPQGFEEEETADDD